MNSRRSQINLDDVDVDVARSDLCPGDRRNSAERMSDNFGGPWGGRESAKRQHRREKGFDQPSSTRHRMILAGHEARDGRGTPAGWPELAACRYPRMRTIFRVV